MLEDYDFELELVPPLHESRPHRNNAGTVRKNRSEINTPGNRQVNVEQAAINGLRKEVMIGSSNARMAPSTTTTEPNINLSREELLKLLSVFEGELQARDEVIEILKSERQNNPAIKERYGLSNLPLQALQRDAASLNTTTNDHVAEQTTQNLQKIIQHQKESYKTLKQALLAAEQANHRLAVEINEEKKKHQEYMIKSDDFVNLLEEERERLRVALENEKKICESREVEMNRKLKVNKDELAKLKSLSLVLVEERQQQVSEISEQKKQIGELERRLKEAEIKWKESDTDITAEKEHAIQLENDLELQSEKFFQSQEEFNTKLEEEKEKNEKLEAKVASLSQQLKKLKSVQKNLQKTDDQLWRIHEKLEQEDEEHELLLEEVELLRQRVKDMEESEQIYTQAQEDCHDIKQKLEKEITMTRNLRSQLKTLQVQVRAQKDLQRSIEDTDFRFDELQLKFEFEKRKSNDMKEHLQKMKARMTELDQYEKVIHECEEKMNKMKEKIILLTSEKNCSDEQVKFLIDKNHNLKSETMAEKEKVTVITEKLIQESKKVLKLREELGQEKQKSSTQIFAMQDKLKEADEKMKEFSSKKQTQAEEANDRLRRQVILLKSRLDKLEAEKEAEASNQADVKDAPQGSTSMTLELVDLVQKLQASEERCEQLSEQLHAKTKLCENLKKVAQENQSNNNCNKKKTSVAVAITQTERKEFASIQSEENLAGNTSSSSEEANSVKKNHTPLGSEKANSEKKTQPLNVSKVAATKFMLDMSCRTPSAGATGAFLPSRTLNKSLVTSTPSSLRSGKVAPSPFGVSLKTSTVINSPKPQVEVKVKKSTNDMASRNGTTIKIKDRQTGASLVKTVGETSKHPVPSRTRNGKCTPDGSRIPHTASAAVNSSKPLTELMKPTKDVVSAKVAVQGSIQRQTGALATKRLEDPQVANNGPSPLIRSRKVAPVAFESSATSEEGTKSAEIAPNEKKERTCGIITKQGQIAKSSTLSQTQSKSSRQKSEKNGSSRGRTVANPDSKIPEHNVLPKSFRTFQAQKDFAELQKKWAAKIGK